MCALGSINGALTVVWNSEEMWSKGDKEGPIPALMERTVYSDYKR